MTKDEAATMLKDLIVKMYVLTIKKIDGADVAKDEENIGGELLNTVIDLMVRGSKR